MTNPYHENVDAQLRGTHVRASNHDRTLEGWVDRIHHSDRSILLRDACDPTTGEELGSAVVASPDWIVETEGRSRIEEIALEAIEPSPYHAAAFSEAENGSFVQDVRDEGYAGSYPVVRPIDGDLEHPGDQGFEIVEGHKRIWACRQAGLSRHPVEVVSLTDWQAARRFAVDHLPDQGIVDGDRRYGFYDDEETREAVEALVEEWGERALEIDRVAFNAHRLGPALELPGEDVDAEVTEADDQSNEDVPEPESEDAEAEIAYPVDEALPHSDHEGEMLALEYEERFLNIEFEVAPCGECGETVVHQIETDSFRGEKTTECSNCHATDAVDVDAILGDEESDDPDAEDDSSAEDDVDEDEFDRELDARVADWIDEQLAEVDEVQVPASKTAGELEVNARKVPWALKRIADVEGYAVEKREREDEAALWIITPDDGGTDESGAADDSSDESGDDSDDPSQSTASAVDEAAEDAEESSDDGDMVIVASGYLCKSKYHRDEGCRYVKQIGNVVEKDLSAIPNHEPCGECCPEAQDDEDDQSAITGERVLEELRAIIEETGRSWAKAKEIAERLDTTGQMVGSRLTILHDEGAIERYNEDRDATGWRPVDDGEADLEDVSSDSFHGRAAEETMSEADPETREEVLEEIAEHILDRIPDVDGGTYVVDSEEIHNELRTEAGGAVGEAVRRAKGVQIVDRPSASGGDNWVVTRDPDVHDTEAATLGGQEFDADDFEETVEDVENAAEGAENLQELADELGCGTERAMRLIGAFELDHLLFGEADARTPGVAD